MQIILLEKVANLGNLGDVVKVKDGYARNFLIPSGQARRATAAAKAEFEAKRAELEKAAAEKLAAGTDDEAFYKAKLQTARFYFQRILPRTRTHVAAMLSGAANLMDMKEEDFDLGY